MQDSDQLQIDLESFNDEMRPMQAASAEAPFSSPDYLFEVKWDGLRCIVFRDSEGHVHLQDRGLHDITADVPEVVAAAKRIPPGSVIDGELVATDKEKEARAAHTELHPIPHGCVLELAHAEDVAGLDRTLQQHLAVIGHDTGFAISYALSFR